MVAPLLYTVGHSTRPPGELEALLGEACVKCVVDVRRYPSSRRHPHYNQGELQRSLGAANLRYVWLGESLGGRQPARLPVEASPNRAWQVPAFRHYADAMETDAFREGWTELEGIAAKEPTAVLCAEKLWWRCHRRLIADLWLARGGQVRHLLEPGRTSEHQLSEWARPADGGVTYPGLL